MNFQQLAFIAGSVTDPKLCANLLREHADMHDQKEKGWWGHFHRLADWIEDGMDFDTPYNVFVEGNGKLPFWAFSSLPGASFCPGAGDCLIWCYSFKSWMYPTAFGRQLMNTLLMLHRRHIIEYNWRKIPSDVHVRLYVDGDIGNVLELRWWMRQCDARSDLKVYGYS